MCAPNTLRYGSKAQRQGVFNNHEPLDLSEYGQNLGKSSWQTNKEEVEKNGSCFIDQSALSVVIKFIEPAGHRCSFLGNAYTLLILPTNARWAKLYDY